MSEQRALLERLVAALERIAPPTPPSTDWLGSPGYFRGSADIRTFAALDALPLETLRGVEEQKAAVRSNVERLARGQAAHDMLLWGARGMGKSALIRSACADVQSHNEGKFALVQVGLDSLSMLPDLLEELGQQDRAFLVFIDDLGFGVDMRSEALQMRSLFDGGVAARPGNVRLAVTSNRRAILDRTKAEQDSPLSVRDDRDDALALADRFGLRLGFHPCDRETYLEIARAYTEPLGLDFNDEEALAWSIERGSLSGRAAWQFAVEIAGRAGKAL
ncbi:MAG: DUF815 domain-containing protein [Pseudomonadota bacterium]